MKRNNAFEKILVAILFIIKDQKNYVKWYQKQEKEKEKDGRKKEISSEKEKEKDGRKKSVSSTQ
jgi:hypothetical protein